MLCKLLMDMVVVPSFLVVQLRGLKLEMLEGLITRYLNTRYSRYYILRLQFWLIHNSFQLSNIGTFMASLALID
jgi:hypothetical protein